MTTLDALSFTDFKTLAQTQRRLIVFKIVRAPEFAVLNSFRAYHAQDPQAVLLETADPAQQQFLTSIIATGLETQMSISDALDLNSALSKIRQAHQNHQAYTKPGIKLTGVIGGSFGLISYESIKYIPGIDRLTSSPP